MLDWKDTLRCDTTEQGPLKRRGCKHRALQQASILLGCPQHSALTPSYTVDNWRREQANSLDSAVNLNYYKHQSYCDVHLTQQKPKKAKQKTRGQTQVWVYRRDKVRKVRVMKLTSPVTKCLPSGEKDRAVMVFLWEGQRITSQHD